MYMAGIGGWLDVLAFANTPEEAKRIAIKNKRRLCKDEEDVMWTWEGVQEYFGAYLLELKPNSVFIPEEYNMGVGDYGDQ